MQGPLDAAAMALAAHVDEVVDDHATEIAEPQLAGNLPGGGDVEVESGFLGVVFLAEAAAVDVDGDEGLGLIDDDGAAGLERHFSLVNLGDFGFELVFVKQRLAALIEVQAVDVARHDEV